MTTEQKIVYLRVHITKEALYMQHTCTHTEWEGPYAHKYTHKWWTSSIDPRATDGTAVKELLVRSLQARDTAQVWFSQHSSPQ